MQIKCLLPMMAAIALGAAGVTPAYGADGHRLEQNRTRTSHNNTVTQRVVTYQCLIGGNLRVTYGFDAMGAPTYARASLHGKQRLMPLNRTYSANMGISAAFGDKNDFHLYVESLAQDEDLLTLGNYRKQVMVVSTVESPARETIHNSCVVRH